MYTTQEIELAINKCGYKLFQLKKANNTDEITTIIGEVSFLIPRRKEKKIYVTQTKKVRWDSAGRCYSLRSNRRLRKFDLPLATAREEIRLKELQSCM